MRRNSAGAARQRATSSLTQQEQSRQPSTVHVIKPRGVSRDTPPTSSEEPRMPSEELCPLPARKLRSRPVHGEVGPPTVSSSSVQVHLRLIQVTPACAELRQGNADQLSCFSACFSLRQSAVHNGQACRKARSLRSTRLLVLLAPRFARHSLVRARYTSNVYIWYSFSTVSYYLTKLEDYAPTPMPTKHRPRHRPPRRRSRWPSWAWRGRGACGACCPRRRCGGRGWRGRGRGGSRRPWPEA